MVFITNKVSIIMLWLMAAARGQRVAPGVPPQQYQQQQYQQQHYQQAQQQQVHLPPGVPPQQYQQQMPVQYQPEIPVQTQQYQQPVPVQNIQQIPQAQPPQQHQLHPSPAQAHGHPQQVLNAGNLEHERSHIQEHMQVPIDTSKMNEAELQFHYFKMHDSDNNNKLDGCELIKSLIHWHEQGSKNSHTEQKPHVEEKVFSDEELVALIDPILQMDDVSRDGYIDYPEFIKAQQKAAASKSQQQQTNN